MIQAAVLLILLIAVPRPQDSQPPPPEASGPQHGIVANVNGEAITTADLEQEQALLLADNPSAAPSEEVAYVARRMLAEEILLAAEARRLGLTVRDEEIDRYLTGIGESTEIASNGDGAGERLRARARRAVESQVYLLHKTGLRTDQAKWVPTDPALARLVAITPRQLREYYRANKSRLDVPATVSCTIYPFPDASKAAPARDRVVAGLGRPEGVKIVEEVLAVPELDLRFSTELADYLRTASPGDVSPVIAIGQGALFVRVEKREAGHASTFAGIQGWLRTQIRREQLDRARRALVRELVAQAWFRPGDLFTPDAPSPFTPDAPSPQGGHVANPVPPP